MSALPGYFRPPAGIALALVFKRAKWRFDHRRGVCLLVAPFDI